MGGNVTGGPNIVNQRGGPMGVGPMQQANQQKQLQQQPNQPNQLSQQKKMRYFLAMFDYDPSTMSPNPDGCEEELPFQEGDTIKVVSLVCVYTVYATHSVRTSHYRFIFFPSPSLLSFFLSIYPIDLNVYMLYLSLRSNRFLQRKIVNSSYRSLHHQPDLPYDKSLLPQHLPIEIHYINMIASASTLHYS